MVATNAMLENATVAISPKAPTAAKASPAVEYSNAANIACSMKVVSAPRYTKYAHCVTTRVVNVSPTSQ